MNEHSFIGIRMALSSPSRRLTTARAQTPAQDKRDAILRAAIVTFARHGYFQAQVAALAAVADPRERLARIARLHLERLGRDRDLAVVFQVELRQSTKFMERFSSSYLRDYINMIRETIVQGQDRGVFRPTINPQAAAKIFFGALDEMATNWILSHRKYPLAADAETVLDIFLNGVGARKRS
jgi:AcrR family transcriptional regulator